MIYAVEIQDRKYVKIGFSDDVSCKSRIATLQTGNPYEIKELFTIDGTLMQEKALHSSLRVAFGRIRMPVPPNEWYPGRHPFFNGFLIDLRFGFDAGLSYIEKYNPAIKQCGAKGERTSASPNSRWPRNSTRNAMY